MSRRRRQASDGKSEGVALTPQPLAGDFGDAGAVEALRRLYGRLDEPPLPAWILEVRLGDVVGSEAETGADAPVGAEAWVVRLAEIERRLLSSAASRATGPVGPMRNSVAAARLLLGAVCEAVARREARAVAPPESRRVRGGSEERLLARLYQECDSNSWQIIGRPGGGGGGGSLDRPANGDCDIATMLLTKRIAAPSVVSVEVLSDDAFLVVLEILLDLKRGLDLKQSDGYELMWLRSPARFL